MYSTWVTVSEEGADGQQHFRNGESWRPVVLEYVQAYHSLAVNVAVVDPRAESHLYTHKQKNNVGS